MQYSLSNGTSNVPKSKTNKLSLGAIVDYSSRAGKEEKVAIEMAIQDFYANKSQPGPILLVKDSRGDPFRAAFSVGVVVLMGINAIEIEVDHKTVEVRLDHECGFGDGTLIRRQHVQAIVGLGTLQESAFVAELGNKTLVPIVSLANEVPFWAHFHWPFMVNAARSQSAQMKVVAFIIQSWRWRRVNIIYEDISSAVTSVIPYLLNSLRDVNSEISQILALPPLTSYNSLSKELKRLKSGQCRVFIVHTSLATATSIFGEAKNLGMMEKGFVWITTTATSNLIDTLNESLISSMQGVLGVKSYFSNSSEQFHDFQSRFQIMFHSQYPDEPHPEPGIYALQAYDAMSAVALAMESMSNWKTSPTVSMTGQELLRMILKSNFKGLTGQVYFKDGILNPAHIFGIVNVVGKSYRELGYWIEEGGFSHSVGVHNNYNTSMRALGQVFWPGGPWAVHGGWAAPTSSKPLQIGVPMGDTHKEFVDATYDVPGGTLNVTGFTIDVFKATLKLLPYRLPYNFTPYKLGTYDSMVQQVDLQVHFHALYVFANLEGSTSSTTTNWYTLLEKTFDAVVADTAIVANRCAYVEFSQPYTDYGVQMLVHIKHKRSDSAWLFKKPFTKSLCMCILAINIYNGFVVWLIERKNHNPDFSGPILKQIGTMLPSAFITLFSLKGDGLHSNWSRMVMAAWLFVALVITQSFTASLTSLLTIQQLDQNPVDVETLKNSGAKVGCDGSSFVVQYLETVIGFQRENIVGMHAGDDYAQALVSGKIAAAFLEVPYVKVLLAKNCKGFATSGPTYKVGGFGFVSLLCIMPQVFPRNSPYLPDISQAVPWAYKLHGSLSDYKLDNNHDNSNGTYYNRSSMIPKQTNTGYFLLKWKIKVTGIRFSQDGSMDGAMTDDVIIAEEDGMSKVDDLKAFALENKLMSLGGIVDCTTRAGKEEKVAMKMAIQDFYSNATQQPNLYVKDSKGDSIRAASSGETDMILSLNL
ncbi:unnamed protein product [Dovyalis caffra]|uniref:Glutamate receptor n=1 Tax=Dovyalis caffra TaxID=77055 RepID=A0AAV1QSG1_9ROSI|nr:unnamed protein product [Dovyalis caffra]